MTRRAAPPFRADHVGSLLRPPELLVARDEFAAGRIDAAQLAAVEDTAIADAVALQENVGLQSATDGEFRREQWHADFLYAIPGIRRGALGAPLPVYRKDGQITWTPNATEVMARSARKLILRGVNGRWNGGCHTRWSTASPISSLRTSKKPALRRRARLP